MTNNQMLSRYQEINPQDCNTPRIERLKIIQRGRGGEVNLGDPNAGGLKMWFCNNCGAEYPAKSKIGATKLHQEAFVNA